MVVLTLIKKDFKLAAKSPCTSLLKFLMVPVLAYLFLQVINEDLTIDGPTEPKILNFSEEIQFGLIGEGKFLEKARQAGLFPKPNFRNREELQKYLEKHKYTAVLTNYIEIVEKNDKREYNFIFDKTFKPALKELQNWFSTKNNENSAEYSELCPNDLAAAAMRIEKQILGDETKSDKVSVTFLQGGDSSLFHSDFIDMSILVLNILYFLVFFTFIQGIVKERKSKSYNLLFRQGIKPIQLFVSKFVFAFCFFSFGIGFTWIYYNLSLFLKLNVIILFVLGINMLVLTLLTGYLVSTMLDSVKSSGFSAVFIFFASFIAAFVYELDFWIGFKYLLQFLPLVNNHTINILVYHMAVDV